MEATLSDQSIERIQARSFCILVLVGAVSAAIFSKNAVIGGLSFGELIFALIVVSVACRAILSPATVFLGGSFLSLLTFVLVVTIGSLAHMMDPSSTFVAGEFLASFLKLLLGISASLAIGVAIRECGVVGVKSVLIPALWTSSLLGVYVIVAMATRALPFEFLWVGQQAAASNVFVGADESLMRMRGIFSEPSLFGSFHALGLGFLLLASKERIWVGHVVGNVISVLLSFSLTAYGLFAVVIILFFMRSRPHRAIPLLVGLAVVAAVSLFLAADIFSRAIVGRVAFVASGSDISGLARLVATWELPLRVFEDFPWTGTGLGNLDVYFSIVGSHLRFESILVESPQGWNVFSYVLGSLGILGLLAFGLVTAEMFRVARRLAILFVAYMFTTGALLEPTFWVFYSIFYHSQLFERRGEAFGRRAVSAFT